MEDSDFDQSILELPDFTLDATGNLSNVESCEGNGGGNVDRDITKRVILLENDKQIREKKEDEESEEVKKRRERGLELENDRLKFLEEKKIIERENVEKRKKREEDQRKKKEKIDLLLDEKIMAIKRKREAVEVVETEYQFFQTLVEKAQIVLNA